MTYPCPSCKKDLEQSGEVLVDGQTLPVFQCEACVRKVKLFGGEFPAALTFALTPDGRLLDVDGAELA